MSELPPLMRDQRRVDTDHLRLLAIFHFIASGMAVIGVLFIIGHYTMFSLFFSNPEMWKDAKGGPPPFVFFEFFKWFYLLFSCWFILSGVCSLMSGIGMLKRKWRSFSVAVAALNCLHMPLGTILGVFTIIVLLRDSVRELYEDKSESFKGNI